VLTFAFSIHNLQPILAANDSDCYPFIVLYYFATGSKGLTTAAVVIIIILIIGASLSAQATAARHVFAFARDEGLPFPRLWSKVSHIGGRDLPVNAFWLSLAVTIVVALVHLGLSAVLHLTIALFVSSILTGCFLVIVCAITARLSKGIVLQERMWTMGRFSIPVNIISLVYIGFAFVMSFFPLTINNLRPSSMNWASLAWFVVLGFSTIIYVVHGRYVFKAPIVVFGRSFENISTTLRT
jgi:choline transport protein